ncbi:lytic transglycosylase domain-containing protein [uncultured Sphingomonas sp.]|uniref:lytic transglycosylase domain-containing protein n=1 Tax=uncultured Sphingomonas sp. TaxID=158754 RepID=UPI002622A144|nr:lytic transglycosylase domain-containing protein [uncultured Sphingomonas sp.]
MARLRAITVAALLAIASPASAETVADWRPLVVEAARRFDVPVDWVERVMRAESAGRTMVGGQPIVSRAGAMGLMQLMPGTWHEMRAALGLGNDPFDPRDNILAGTAYLRAMYDRFGYPGLFAAYNAGPARYAAWLAGRQRLPGETRAYLASITGDTGSVRQITPAMGRAPRRDMLFVMPGTTVRGSMAVPPDAPAPGTMLQSGGPFAIRKP